MEETSTIASSPSAHNPIHELTPKDSKLINDVLELYQQSTRAEFDSNVLRRLFCLIAQKDETPTRVFSLLLSQSELAEYASLLGFFSHFGFGCQGSNAEAFKWYSLAADHGDCFALLQVGECYEKGYGISCDYKKAIQCYKETALRGHPQGAYKFAESRIGRQRDWWVTESARRGFWPGILKFVYYCNRGIGGQMKDKHLALRWALRYKRDSFGGELSYTLVDTFRNPVPYRCSMIDLRKSWLATTMIDTPRLFLGFIFYVLEYAISIEINDRINENSNSLLTSNP
ncbi:hypothetical protein G9A89_017296 [Geosiphon pyriformis]|nr:hypothetical protein G9A89_017296 [Geosiphon pyriformis]